MKPSSSRVYAGSLKRFCCRYANVKPYDFPSTGLARIEDLMAGFIADNRDVLAPKFLNLIFNAVKRWCQIQRLIKTTKMFKEIKFDKSSRKTRDRMMLTKAIVKKLFDNADLREKIVIALYGINGLCPSLIPQILIEDIHPNDIKLDENSVELSERTWIWVKREYEGNKANMDFPIMTTAEESAWIEEYLNGRIRKSDNLTSKSQVVLVKDKRAVSYIVNKLFRIVGFDGRNYLLRHYAYKQFKLAFEDYDLREWLMGHKGKISGIYDHEHYLTNEQIREYKAMVDTKALHVYGLSSSQEQVIKALIQTVRALADLDKNEIDKLRKELTSGKINAKQFSERITQSAQDTTNKQLENKFEQMFLKMNAKYNNNH